MSYSKTVFETCIRGARKHMMNRGKLAYVFQSLKFFGVDDFHKEFFPVRVSMDGTVDGFHT